jgi:preprotein translocase subunit SecB
VRLLGASANAQRFFAAPNISSTVCKDSIMADQEPTPGGNGSGEPGDEPQVSILAQYIKDLSVENPSAPQVFQWQVQPTLDVQFNINLEKVADDVHEIMLKIEVTARSENGVHFVVDLSYAGLFGLRNMPEEALPPFLLIEAPRLMFPFVRQIIADAVINTGFPPLLLDPIDFASAYVAQLQAAQQQGGESNGSGEQSASDSPSEA